MIKKPEQQVGIERRSRISPTLLSLLNTQIKNELYSSQIYSYLSSWLNRNDFNNGSKLFLKYSKEELDHMYKIYNYIYDRNSVAVVGDCPPISIDISGLRNLLEVALQHEMQVTKNWNDIACKASDESDHTTYEFAQWFVKEQIEEENKFREYLQHMNVGLPAWRLEEIFGESI